MTSDLAATVAQTLVLLLGIYKTRGRDDERLANVKAELKEHKELPVARAHPAA